MQQGNKSQAYRSSQRLGSNARDTEAQALLEAARKLDAVVGGDDQDAYRTALRQNWRLWTIIQADVSGEDSPLPDEIRQNILSLSVFIDKHTVSALAEPSGRKLRVLIDINRHIAGGLMANFNAQADVSAEPAQPAPARPRVDGDIIA
jgi:flagellar biosynthesis activator protein FlaF